MVGSYPREAEAEAAAAEVAAEAAEAEAEPAVADSVRAAETSLPSRRHRRRTASRRATRAPPPLTSHACSSPARSVVWSIGANLRPAAAGRRRTRQTAPRGFGEGTERRCWKRRVGRRRAARMPDRCGALCECCNAGHELVHGTDDAHGAAARRLEPVARCVDDDAKSRVARG